MVRILALALLCKKGANDVSFCPKCGREIVDESLGCPICDMAKKQDQTEKVDSFVIEDDKGTYQKFENNQPNQQYQSVEQTIHPALKVIVIALIILVGGVGAIAGLIAGIVLMKSPIEDYQKFGKLITIISAVMLGLSLLCCVLGNLLYGMALVNIPLLYD